MFPTQEVERTKCLEMARWMEDLPTGFTACSPTPPHFSISGCEKSLWPSAVLQLLFLPGFSFLPCCPRSDLKNPLHQTLCCG